MTTECVVPSGVRSCREALLLVGHGTRDERGVAEFMRLSEKVAARVSEIRVLPCFLELAEPSIECAVATAIGEGAERLVVAPVLLFAAGHAKRDIPATVATAIAKHADDKGVNWRQADVMDCHPAIAEVSAARFAEAVARLPPVPPGETCLAFVGRGSRDADATAAMLRFSQLQAAAAGIDRVETGFVAMAQPRYQEVLRQFARLRPRRIVVQPHLLFHGELLTEIRREVERLQTEFAATEWIVTEHLGSDDRLAQAVIDLCDPVRAN